MKKLILTLTAIFVIATPLYFVATDAREQAAQDAHENAEANARYILSQNQTDETIETLMTAKNRATADKMIEDLRPLGGELIDPMAFVKAWVGDPSEVYLATAREVGTALYLELFTPEQLADIAGFYRSDAGQAMAAVFNQNKLNGAPVGQEIDWGKRLSFRHYFLLTMFVHGKSGGAWNEMIPVLAARAEEDLAEASAIFRENLTVETAAYLIAREDLVVFEDPAMRDYVVWYMTGRIGPEPPLPKHLVDKRVADTE